ncbi:MAG TPA: outer membrane protein [Methylocella sp.]|nr:outer membrane protein [Methylocella sp.]
MMKRILLASAGAMALAGTSMAADLRPPPPVYLPPPPTWTGFYAGINAGYQWNSDTSASVLAAPFGGIPAFVSVPVSQNAFIGGGQIGYNYQFANSWVVGLEADFDGLTTSHPEGSAATFGFGLTATQNLDYLGTVRGRIGYLLTPTLLIFGGGGLAYGDVSTNFGVIQTTPLVGFAAGPGIFETKVGWTAGGGVEWQFMPNWSLKVEYLYYDLGSLTTVSPLLAGPVPVAYGVSQEKTTFTGNVVRAGLNYHFNWGWPAPVVAKY